MTALILAIEWLVGLIVCGAIACRAFPRTPDDLPRQHGEGEWVRGDDQRHNEAM